jgi:hypothetical protein
MIKNIYGLLEKNPETSVCSSYNTTDTAAPTTEPQACKHKFDIFTMVYFCFDAILVVAADVAAFFNVGAEILAPAHK